MQSQLSFQNTSQGRIPIHSQLIGKDTTQFTFTGQPEWGISKFPPFDKADLLTPATVSPAEGTVPPGAMTSGIRDTTESLNGTITDLRVQVGDRDAEIMHLRQENDALRLQLKSETSEKERVTKKLLSDSTEKEKLLEMLVKKDTELNTLKEVRLEK